METQHEIKIEDNKKVTATAIQSVDNFSAQQIVLSYAKGRIIITGSDLKIINFSQSGGGFMAIGTVQTVKYSHQAIGVAKRIFK